MYNLHHDVTKTSRPIYQTEHYWVIFSRWRRNEHTETIQRVQYPMLLILQRSSGEKPVVLIDSREISGAQVGLSIILPIRMKGCNSFTATNSLAFSFYAQGTGFLPAL